MVDLSIEMDDFAGLVGVELVFVPSRIEDVFLPISLFTGSGSPAPKMLVCPPPGGLKTLLEGRAVSPKPILKFVEVIFAKGVPKTNKVNNILYLHKKSQ